MEAKTHDKIDEVDIELAAEDGQIKRSRDPRMCNHGARQKCTHCLPIDPWDEDYLKSKEIRHMSFHAYVRKLLAGHGKGSKLRKPLETLRTNVDLTCDAHKPFPKGICTRCRPPMVSLNRQRFRHVDNISIENQDIVNSFLDYWRKSGHQRLGYLIGKYECFNEVPLGIKARVVAIYEPPQISSDKAAGFLDDPNKDVVDKLCGWLGLRRVGWIFTDLWSADPVAGTVHCTRNADTYLLSAEEVITAGWLQSQYPNVTEFSTEGKFGSKFVTVVASGNENQEISFFGYQVSNQASALVEANVLCPTQYPELAHVRQTPLNESHYITDVQYTMKNEYGVEVTKDGKPLPVEFLLVDVPAGMPKDPECTFHVPRHQKLHIENRQTLGQFQGLNDFAEHVKNFSSNQFLEAATNFHFLLYLATNEHVKFSDEELKALCDVVKAQERGAAMDWATDNANFQTLISISHHSEQGPSSPSAAPSSSSQVACKHCTFHNDIGAAECAMCLLPPQ